MPYIAVSTSAALSQPQKEELKSTFGQLITMLPNKTEKVLMVDISDGHTLYLDGKAIDNGAYVDIRLYGTAPFAAKSELTDAVYKLLNDVAGIKHTDAYVTYSEFNTWGISGHLK